MIDGKAPAYISHTVLIHAGSYKDFVSKLAKQFPLAVVRFSKKVAIHYYIVQIEDRSVKGYTKKELYELPMMAMREEFSSFVFFKSIKGYNNVLKRMCGAPERANAPYDLIQHLLTPFEKMILLGQDRIQSLTVEGLTEQGQKVTTTYFNKDEMVSKEAFEKIFAAETVKINKDTMSFITLIKDKQWKVGIH